MRGRGHAFLAAFQFLSRFPVRTELDFTPELLKRSTRYYPMVGAAIGVVLSLISCLLAQVLPGLVSAVIVLIVWVYLTGGLHLDGWMDTADGLLSYRSRDKMLEIMKDSRVGAMGVIACVLLLLLKTALIASLLEQAALPAALLTAPLWSRWFMVYAMAAWPQARGPEGLAGRFGGMRYKSALLAGLWALVLSAAGLGLCVFIGYGAGLDLDLGSGSSSGSGWIKLGILWIVLPLAAWSVGTYVSSRISRKLGGLTGDVYGALNEGLEVLLLLIVTGVTH
ncbi:adenosylcobinamide-GDP ribazoletransferase [Paenibacillus tuaregi]|uniref:adenosylcobinamide-GDP ribazoletransferase n=1 Tax=Paenibacillus tuaregi TaxID=1816681 RepID=UPI0008380CD7|nr:adenosylcobinamide-GDP ribazoletransferase [Paenibacillus tuaregi]